MSPTTDEILAQIHQINNGPKLEVEIDTSLGKKNIILDATMLTAIMNCGRFTDLRFNHSLMSIKGKSNSLECGSIAHKVLEVFYQSIIHGLKRTDAIQFGLVAGEMYIKGCPHCTEFVPHPCSHCNGLEGMQCVYCQNGIITKPSCSHPPNEYPGVKNTPPENDSSSYLIGWKWVLETCEQYFDFYKNDFWVPLETEVVKRKILYEDDEIRIMWKAKLDLTIDNNQGIFPVDHKTLKQNRTTLSLNNQFIGQCLMMETRNAIINKIGFQTTLKPEKKFTRQLMSYSSDRLLEWQSEILPYWAYQLLSYSESGHWPPNFTNCESKYGPCMFSDVCSSDRGMRTEELRQHFMVIPKWDVDNLEKD